MGSRKIFALDTSAFIAGFNPSEIDYDMYSVPHVEKELVKAGLPKVRFQTAVESGKLKIQIPHVRYVKAVKESATETGDILYLSEADILVLALAAQLKDEGCTPTVVTDDYSMQNVASKNNISFTSLATFGIRYRLQWQIYCPACRKKYPSNYKHIDCQICGTKLKRKPKTKSPTNQDT